jgi:hypothetical protein
MLDNSGIFAFDTDFVYNNRKALLEVFVKYNPDNTTYYYCIIDDKYEFTFAKNADGAWADMKTGPSQLAISIGAIIERELSLDHRFHSH